MKTAREDEDDGNEDQEAAMMATRAALFCP